MKHCGREGRIDVKNRELKNTQQKGYHFYKLVSFWYFVQIEVSALTAAQYNEKAL